MLGHFHVMQLTGPLSVDATISMTLPAGCGSIRDPSASVGASEGDGSWQQKIREPLKADAFAMNLLS